MKFLFVIPYYAPAWGYGGPPVIITSVAEELAKRGHFVSVYTTDALDGTIRSAPATEIRHGVHIIRCRNLSNRLAWQAKLFAPLGFRGVINQNIGTFDYVFLSDLRTYQNMIAARACQKRGIPYGVAAFGQLPYTTGFKMIIKRIYDLIWGKKILKNASTLLAQTDHEANCYLEHGGSKSQIKLWPLGIDTRELANCPARGTFRKQHNLGSAPYILFVGRLHAYKGVDRLIDTVAQIKPKFPDLKLVIVGRDDGAETALKDQVHTLGLDDTLIWTGPMYGNDNTAVYQDATVFTFTPSHFEETSLAALKALALGVPVVTSHQAPIPWLEKYRAGFEIDRDTKSIEKALLKILKNRQAQHMMSIQAQKLIEDHFTIPAIVDQLISYIDDQAPSQLRTLAPRKAFN